MIPKSSISLSFLFLLFSSATSFNITKLLDQHPDFSNFNSFLTQTHLAEEINKRQTITILAVDNGAASQLSGKPADQMKKIMSLHVVLDYYDADKLKQLSKKTALLTTMFQASGAAKDQQGFLNVTDMSSGQVAFGSAVKGETLGANLVKSVAAQPYNISVLQVSALIMPSGVLNSNSSTSNSTSSSSNSTSTSPASAPKKAQALASSPKKAQAPSLSPKKAPTSAPAKAPSKADAPAKSEKPPAPAPAPSKKDVESDVPVSPPKGGPVAEAPAADAPGGDDSDTTSSARRVGLGSCLAVVMVVLSFWVSL